MSKLFSPIKVGKVNLSNRIALSPLTRARATPDHVPTDLMAEYYAQRAHYPGTLLVSEATGISPGGIDDGPVPGIWNNEQIEGWKKVIDQVKQKKGSFWVQIWHQGRTSQKAEINKGDVVSASNVPISEDTVTPRPLETDEIKKIANDYAVAAKNAIAAGADGVEIHGANGYLLDQFLNPLVNKRTDEYGGSIENRSRFMLETVDAVVKAVGSDKAALRLTPFGVFQGMEYPYSPISQHSYLIEQLEKRAVEKNERLAYLHIMDSTPADNKDYKWVRELWKGVLVMCGDFQDAARRNAAFAADDQLITAIGRYFLSTPDLVKRIELGDEEMNEPQWDKLYGGDAAGYTDYPLKY